MAKKRSVKRSETPADYLVRLRKAQAKGGKIGGKSRAKALSPERRSELASTAAKARWNKDVEPIGEPK